MDWFKTLSGSLIAFILAAVLQVFFFSPISPGILEFPNLVSIPGPSNTRLQEVIKLGEGVLVKPEAVAIDEGGILYTASRDGWIKRMHRNGSWESWKYVGGDGLLGVTISKNGGNGVIVCDVEKGLLKVTDDGVTVVASHVNGSPIKFADDVVEGSDGSLYFSVGSTKFGFHEWYLDFLEAKPHGQLLKYDPASDQTTILLHDLWFANGVTLSPLQDYLIICESWKYRCLKYWLQGEKKGQTDIFVENLPGAPDNINLAPDSTYWIALLEMIPSNQKFLHSSKVLKQLLVAFPRLLRQINGAYKKAMVGNVDSHGKVLKVLEDPIGKVMSMVTSALEFEGHLYLGTLNCDFVGKLPLGL